MVMKRVWIAFAMFGLEGKVGERINQGWEVDRWAA